MRQTSIMPHWTGSGFRRMLSFVGNRLSKKQDQRIPFLKEAALKIPCFRLNRAAD